MQVPPRLHTQFRKNILNPVTEHKDALVEHVDLLAAAQGPRRLGRELVRQQQIAVLQLRQRLLGVILSPWQKVQQ